MNKMKFASLMVGLTGILTIIGCGPSFHSMRDVDDFLAKEKVKAQKHYRNMPNEEELEVFKNGFVIVLKPSIRAEATGVDLGLSAINVLVGNYGMAAAGAVGGGPSSHMKVTGLVEFALESNHCLYSRKKPGSPDWDMGVEAVNLVGPPPASKACIFEGILVFPRAIGTNTYKGNDGEAITSSGAWVLVWFSSKPGATVPCDKNTWGIYSDYIKIVGRQISKLALKQFADDGKDTPEFAVRK